ncbi:hypothetical protein ABH926_009017 [Catenulispora sp. GP43]
MGGHGMWLVHQICDLVQIQSGPTEGTVGLEPLKPDAAPL